MDDGSSSKAKWLLGVSLSRFNRIVSRVKVTFCDVNGPKGGLDKRCRIAAKLKTTGQVVVRDSGHDFAEALTLCLEKLVRAIRRDVDRRRTKAIRKNRMHPRMFVDKSSESWRENQAGICG